MGILFLLFASLCICISLHSLLNLFRTKLKLPPSPPTIPFLGNLLWLLKSSQDFSNLEPVLRRLRAKYGPIVTLHIGSRPAIFITSHGAAHRALVQNAAVFASRPPALEATKIFFSNQHTVSSAAYGPLWRVLRQNLATFLHPSRLHLFANGRKWAYSVLREKLRAEAELAKGKAILVQDHFQHAVFCLLVYICFGEKLEETAVREIEAAQRPILTNFIRFNVLNFMPRLGKIVFRKLWRELLEIRRNQEDVMLPLIRQRQDRMNNKKIKNHQEDTPDPRTKKTHQEDTSDHRTKKDHQEDVENIVPYVDTLFEIRLPEEHGGRKFTNGEMVSLCSEFLNGGTDTSMTTLQWAMANLVKHQEIQEKLAREISLVVTGNEEIKTGDLEKMPYLKAIVLETLRRHPPGHFILPRAVTEDTVLDGFRIPTNAMVNFTVAEMGWDPSVWEDPMEFRPERFLSEGGKVEFDMKGAKGIKMMPFGAGRRVCPAITMALLHQQYFVANLVRDFKWEVEDGGEDVDLSEKQDFTMIMKNPLKTHISPRIIG
ncbi:hypothetical protein RHMOL_Rhmol07G0222000 [Rhododendron molle]|uniref:Uncharacterized protein n=1 Tax=Rhododendron molle TaxID=49168 RepID=A0ACC0N4I7_RHOML|nr:hypothetical protein RHMOL_Rhmol07G0222000 [Rhododendron molle]